MPVNIRVIRPSQCARLLPSQKPTFNMPLRAKIQNPAFPAYPQQRQYATSTDIPKELPGDTPDDVVFNNIYGLRTIELNRPKKLNSLDGSMCRKILPRLKEWEKSDMISAVVMKGSGEKALCAGGDVAVLSQWCKQGPEGQQRAKDYFGLEYKLDHLIATYSKPYIAFMDGITMGGGVGLSVHAPFRIATERTVFAMPETTIGFFPEVGASFFLPRMDGKLGLYLALTSERLQGVQAFYHGVATHYLHSSSLPDLEARLAELTIPDHASSAERLSIINKTINEFETGLPHDQPIQLGGSIRKAIDRCFSQSSVNDVLKALESETEHKEWAQKTLKTINQRSPTSLKVTHRQLGLGSQWDIAHTFEREYNIAAAFMEHHDFAEGVSARLVEKPPKSPEWQPKTLDEVSEQDVDNFFRTEGKERLALMSESPETQYKEYPHAWIALPSEEAIRQAVSKLSAKSKSEVIQHFLSTTGGKAGVSEKVSEVLDRQTQVVQGKLRWDTTI